MPRLPATHQKTNATANAFPGKKNNAAIAPTWNAPRKKVVVQLIGSWNVLSSANTLMVGLSSTNFLLPITTVSRGSTHFCNTCVIPLERVAKLQLVRKYRRISVAYDGLV